MPRMIDTAARKEELARALWQVVCEQGIGAVSVRSVAAQAGLAVGSLRHVFPSRAELLIFSAELMFRHVSDRISSLTFGQDPVDNAMQIVRQVLPLTSQTRAEMEVNIALIAEARALPALVRVRDAAARDLQEICRVIVLRLSRNRELVFGQAAAVALPDDERAATRLHALLDGLALTLVQRNDDGAWAEEIVRAELEALSALSMGA